MSDRRGTPPDEKRLAATLERAHVVTMYGRDAAVVEFEPRDPLDSESFGYLVSLTVSQGDLEGWCKQVPTGRACPFSGNKGIWCKHLWAAVLAWGQAIENT